MSVNHVVITGNLTADPEIRYLPSGMAVTKLRVAVNNNYKDKKTGEWKEDTCFIDVDVWGNRAERMNEACHKGSKVLVEGSLREDNWEDREGKKRSKIKIRAFTAEHIGEPRGSDRPVETGAPAAGAPDDAPPPETDDDLPF